MSPMKIFGIRGVLLHAPAGAYIVQEEFGIQDPEIFPLFIGTRRPAANESV
ncbi:hypothetical protein [Salicibibacter halophilus]|uniref:hypothetical protein n=1 Tax=Salicibibacter halophilus TaxID=2502791 RepID=UPI001D045718|nr:hypothetical protein [Salicibibacter halophilus]